LVRDGFSTDGFDAWSAQRDRIYERDRTSSYVSRQMVGYADLDANGTWETVADYGAVWYPSAVAPDWVPYSDGYWTDVSGWGSTWVDAAPWGYAPFHYGRWAHIRGRWGWCPGSYVARPVWAPALVGWVGGPGWGLAPLRGSGSSGSSVYGWVPLGWGEAYRPPPGRCGTGCWERYNRPYAVNPASRASSTPARLANVGIPGAMTVVPGAVIALRKPVPINRLNVPGNLVAAAPPLQQAPLARALPGQVPGIKPGNGVPRPASTMYATSVRRSSPSPFAPANMPQGSGVAAGSLPATRQGLTGQPPMSGTPSSPGNRSAQGGSPPMAGPVAEPLSRAAPSSVVAPASVSAKALPPATTGTQQQVNTYTRPVTPVPALPPERAGGSAGQPANGRVDPRSMPLPTNATTAQPTLPSTALPSPGTAAARPALQLPPGTMPAPLAAPPAGGANVRAAPQLPAGTMPAPLAAPSGGGASVRAAPQLAPVTMPAPLAVPPSGHPANVTPTGPPPAGQPSVANPGNPAVRAPTTDKEKATIPANANPNALPGNVPVR